MLTLALVLAAAPYVDPDALPPGAVQRLGTERFGAQILALLDDGAALVCRGQRLRLMRADGLEAEVDAPVLGCPAVVVDEDGGVRAFADRLAWWPGRDQEEEVTHGNAPKRPDPQKRVTPVSAPRVKDAW